MTDISTSSQIMSFSNSSTKSNSKTNRPPATSVSYGGKSRYLCLSDAGGYVSVWDTRKQSRARHLHAFSSSSSSSSSEESLCNKACIDPTDTFIAALSSQTSGGDLLRLFNLRDTNMVHSYSLDGTGGADAFQFSSLETNHVAVGTHDGSVFLWDVNSSSKVPTSSILQCHEFRITSLNFSPVNRVLVATSSLDGTFSFLDVHSEKLIQRIQPSLGSVTCFDFHADGLTCAVGLEDDTVCLYDLRKATSGPVSTLRVGDDNSSPYSNGSSSSGVVAVKFATEMTLEKKTKGRSATKSRSKSPNSRSKSPKSRSKSPVVVRQEVTATLPAIVEAEKEEHNTFTTSSHYVTQGKIGVEQQEHHSLHTNIESSLSSHFPNDTVSNPTNNEGKHSSTLPSNLQHDALAPSHQTEAVESVVQHGTTVSSSNGMSQQAQHEWLSPTLNINKEVNRKLTKSSSKTARYTAGNSHQHEYVESQKGLDGTATMSKTPSTAPSSMVRYGNYSHETPLHVNGTATTTNMAKTPSTTAPSSTARYEQYSHETPLHMNLTGGAVPLVSAATNGTSAYNKEEDERGVEDNVDMKVNKVNICISDFVFILQLDNVTHDLHNLSPNS
uniref:Uncharacterized protein n=1 Tax=Ditylum brightwellii TaxID=49249 RepID=A0A7S4RC31_9STRA